MSDIFDDLMMEIDPHTEHTDAEQSFANVCDDFFNNKVRAEAVRLTEDPTFDMNEADMRFSTSLPLGMVRGSTVAIVGGGGLGNWQWRVLMGMGFRNVHIFDDDTVDTVNIGPQAHNIMDRGLPKVEAIRRAAMYYRGVNIHAHNQRVMTYEELVEAVGTTPDIIIGCTDSAEFRNSFIQSLFKLDYDESVDEDERAENTSLFAADQTAFQLPKLWLDYRMSLGDWTCFAMPVRSMFNHWNGDDNDARYMVANAVHKYVDEAVFPPSEAMQEACTERAICYTGAQAAAFSGAYIHWFLTNGQRIMGRVDRMANYFYGWETEPMRGEDPMQFLWRTIFSARDFEFISATRREQRLNNRMNTLRNRRNGADMMATDILQQQFSDELSTSFHVESFSDSAIMDCTWSGTDLRPMVSFDNCSYMFNKVTNRFERSTQALYSRDMRIVHDYFAADTFLHLLRDYEPGQWLKVEYSHDLWICLKDDGNGNLELVQTDGTTVTRIQEARRMLGAFVYLLRTYPYNGFRLCDEVPEIREEEQAEETTKRVEAQLGDIVDLSDEGFEETYSWESTDGQFNILRNEDTGETLRVSVKVTLWAATS